MDYNNLAGTIMGLSIGLLVIVSIFAIALIVVLIIALWKLFEKNGEEGWKSLIPFYNSYVLTQISGLNWWYFLILIFGSIFANTSDNGGMKLLGQLGTMFVDFLIFYNLAKKAKKDPIGIAILGALFTPIIEIIMAFSDKYQFDNSIEVSPNGIFNGNIINTTNNEPDKYCLGCGKKLKPNSKFCENCDKQVE